MSPEQALEVLKNHPDPYARYQAVDYLASLDLRTPEVLEGLVQALADGGSWEVLEPGAPSHLYLVSERALEVLGEKLPESYDVFEKAAEASPEIALAGVKLNKVAGPKGLERLLKCLRENEPRLARASLNQLIDLLRDSRRQAPAWVPRSVIEALLHPDATVRAEATNYLPYYFGAHPEQDPMGFVDDVFLDQLSTAISTGQVPVEAGRCFLLDERMLQAWLDAVARGEAAPSIRVLLRPHLGRVTRTQAEQLINAPLRPAVIDLLGELKDLAVGSIPRLVDALEDPETEKPALLALSKIPGGLPRVQDRLAELFLRDEPSRAELFASHPFPELFAEELIARLLELWHKTKNRTWLRAMKLLGPHMVSRRDWLISQLEKHGSDSYTRTTAIEILGTFGREARPAFPKLLELLDHDDTRSVVLSALKCLGPAAASDFLPRLKELHRESLRWHGWKANWWKNLVAEALEAVERTPSDE